MKVWDKYNYLFLITSQLLVHDFNWVTVMNKSFLIKLSYLICSVLCIIQGKLKALSWI